MGNGRYRAPRARRTRAMGRQAGNREDDRDPRPRLSSRGRRSLAASRRGDEARAGTVAGPSAASDRDPRERGTSGDVPRRGEAEAPSVRTRADSRGRRVPRRSGLEMGRLLLRG